MVLNGPCFRPGRAAIATVMLLALPPTLSSFVGVRVIPPLVTRTVGAAMCDRTAPRAHQPGEWAEEDDADAWETAQMPSSDYDAVGQSGSIDVRRSGIDAVRQCLRKTKTVLPLLKEIASRDFFSFYAVNLITPCMYYADVGTSCEMDRCEITPVRDRDVPSVLLDRDLHEYGFTIDGDPNPKLAVTLHPSRSPPTPPLSLDLKLALSASRQVGAGRTCLPTSPNTSTSARALAATPGTTARACGASSTPRSASPSDSTSPAAPGSGNLVSGKSQ